MSAKNHPQQYQQHTPGHNMPIHYYYSIGSFLLLLLAWLSNYLLLNIILVWIGLSLAMVSVAYWLNKPGIFRKSANGKIPVGIRWLFIPFLYGVMSYNRWARKQDTVPPIQEIDPGLFVGAYLRDEDMPLFKEHQIKAIVDVTAEIDTLEGWFELDINYLNIAVLDHFPPKAEQILQGIGWIETQRKQGRSVVIHCALGRGRSVLVMAAYLLAKYPDWSVGQAIRHINKTRPQARLNRRQKSALQHMRTENLLKLES